MAKQQENPDKAPEEGSTRVTGPDISTLIPQNYIIENETISLQELFDAMPVALALLDRQGNYIAFNEKQLHITGLTHEEMTGKSVADLGEGRVEENIRRDFHEFDAGHEVPDHELLYNGWIYQVSVKPLRRKDGYAIGDMAALTDISHIKKIEEELHKANTQLERYAKEDYLTGVWNRRYFNETMTHAIHNLIQGKEQILSVLMMDVDFFKAYNDIYGHLAGDECLKTVASALQSVLWEPHMTLYRYGGEEFIAILRGLDVDQSAVMAEKLRTAIQTLNLPHEGSALGMLTLSIGIASCQVDAGDSDAAVVQENLLSAADKALYAAKALGRNRVCAGSGV